MGHPPLCVTFSIHLSVHRAPFLRNRTSSNHNFWYTCVKWRYLLVFFSFFWNFDFLGCWGVKRQKIAQKWKLTMTSVTRHISGTIHHIIIFGTFVQSDDISRHFFSFFWNFHFLGCYGGKRAKNSPKRKITITSVALYI